MCVGVCVSVREGEKANMCSCEPRQWKHNQFFKVDILDVSVFFFSALHTGRPDIESPSTDAGAPPSTVPSLVEGTLCTNRHLSINSGQKVNRNFFFWSLLVVFLGSSSTQQFIVGIWLLSLRAWCFAAY